MGWLPSFSGERNGGVIITMSSHSLPPSLSPSLPPSLSPSLPPSLSLSLSLSLPPSSQKPTIHRKRTTSDATGSKATPPKRKPSPIHFSSSEVTGLSPQKRESRSLYQPPRDRFSKNISNGSFRENRSGRRGRGRGRGRGQWRGSRREN